MKFTPTPLQGLMILEPQVFEDSRGYFYESYNKTKFIEVGISEEFVQDNQSYSQKGSLRGLHFQKPPSAQSKIVRVISGEVFDVAVDLRADSPTLGKWFGLYLSGENKKMLYIPEGFAHGFCVTSDAVFCYKCSDLYSHADEDGILYNDPELNIEWPLPTSELKLSEKDALLKTFAQIKKEVVW